MTTATTRPDTGIPDDAAAPPPGRGGGRLRKIFIYGTSRGLTEGIFGVRGLILASMLGPKAFGSWTLFRLAVRFSPFLDLGIYRGLERDISRTDPVEGGPVRSIGELAARTTVGFVTIAYGIVVLAAFGASFLVPDAQIAWALRICAVAVMAEQYAAYAFVYLRAHRSLRRYAVAETVRAGMHLVLALGGALLWGLLGALGGFALANVISLGLLLPGIPLRPTLDLAQLRRMLTIGLPMMTALLASTALATVDRFVVTAYGGRTLLGYYAFAVSIAGLTGSFAWVLRTVIFPDIYGRADEVGARHAVRDHLSRTMLPFAHFYPPILGACALAIGPAVAHLVPHYHDAIGPAKVFLFTGVAVGFASLGSLSLVAADRQRVLPALSGGALVLNLALSLLALRAGIGLEGVAAGALISQAVYGAAILGLTADAAGVRRPIRLVVAAVLPLAYCAVVVAGLDQLLPTYTIGSTAVAYALYLLALLPLAPAIRLEVRRLRGPARGRAD